MSRAIAAVEAMNRFKLNDMNPFDPSAGDLARTSLEHAHAITIILAAAFGDESGDTASTNPNIIQNALEGVARLIALSAFAEEGA